MKNQLRKILDEIQDLENKVRESNPPEFHLVRVTSYFNAARRNLLNAGAIMPEALLTEEE